MQTVRDIVAETLHHVVDPLVYDEAVSLIEEHHLAGRDVIIVSASGTEVVGPIGELLGADGVVATQMEIVDGRYTGEIDYYAYGANKAEALRRLAEEHHYDLARSYAYSDSVTDLHMLEAVGHPFAVNPDRELRREADDARLAGAGVHPTGRAAQPDAAAADHRDARRAGAAERALVGATVYLAARRLVAPQQLDQTRFVLSALRGRRTKGITTQQTRT